MLTNINRKLRRISTPYTVILKTPHVCMHQVPTLKKASPSLNSPTPTKSTSGSTSLAFRKSSGTNFMSGTTTFVPHTCSCRYPERIDSPYSLCDSMPGALQFLILRVNTESYLARKIDTSFTDRHHSHRASPIVSSFFCVQV